MKEGNEGRKGGPSITQGSFDDAGRGVGKGVRRGDG